VVDRPLAPPTPYARLAMAYRRDVTSEVLTAFPGVVRQAFRRRR
jgi:hypothetical protein